MYQATSATATTAAAIATTATVEAATITGAFYPPCPLAKRARLTIAGSGIISLGLEDYETIAQEVSTLGQRVSDLENRLEHAEKMNAGLEEAALTTARALQEISAHWDKVYEAMRRKDASQEP
jgi:hypothetical protein